MKEKKLPVIVTTMEGIEVGIENSVPIIYVDMALYSKFGLQIDKVLCQSEYEFSRKGKSGLFYIKAEGDSAFDLWKHEIYDPMGIL